MYYIAWLGKIIDVQKCRIQVTKIMKKYIKEHSTIKYIRNGYFDICFRHVCTISRLSSHHGRKGNSSFYTSLSNIETVYYIIWVDK